MINAVLNATITATVLATVAYFAIAAVAFTHDRILYRQPVTVEPVEIVTAAPMIEPTPTPVVETANGKKLEEMSWRELVAMAGEVGIKNRRNLKKFELVEAIAQLA